MQLLHSAYGLSGVMDLDFDVKMIHHAVSMEVERAAWDMWTATIPKTRAEDMVPFSEYKSKLIKRTAKVTPKSFDEIEAEMALVVAAYNAKKRGE